VSSQTWSGSNHATGVSAMPRSTLDGWVPEVGGLVWLQLWNPTGPCDWVRFHGGDPGQMPTNATITRDLDHCRVVLPVFVLDDEGNRILERDEDGIPVKFKLATAVLQGEAPPLPLARHPARGAHPMTTQQPRLELADMVRELCEWHQHAEHYQIRKGATWYGGNHVTRVPPLLLQLWDAPEPSGTVEEGLRPGYASKPAARLDSLDVGAMIDLEASRWVRDLGEDDPADRVDQAHPDRFVPGSGAIACIRLLHGLAAGEQRCKKPGRACCTAHEIERDVRRWWTQARIITGWDLPPWKPDNTCPQCGERGTLKVNLAIQGGFCTSCRATWDDMTIGLLADHIRGESESERVPRTPPVACERVERPAGLRWGLCPACGSSSCARGVETAAREEIARLADVEARRAEQAAAVERLAVLEVVREFRRSREAS